MIPRAAVSRYRVNKVGKTAAIYAIFKRSFSIWPGFFRGPESNRDAREGQAFAEILKQKGRRERRPLVSSGRAGQ
jgi:hypothetical protein